MSKLFEKLVSLRCLEGRGVKSLYYTFRITGVICGRLWEKGPLGSGDQFLVYCPIRKNSFCAFKCTLKHKKLIFLTEVIGF